MTFRTRFAPSPTGPLHLGHAYSAMLAYDMACEQNGDFILRIEDIDQSRARPEWEQKIYDDLEWLGLWWPTPVLKQSERKAEYRKVIQNLWAQNYLYACICNRRDIMSALSAPQEGAPLHGPDGVIYPGTCQSNGSPSGRFEIPDGAALRLRMTMAGISAEETSDDGHIQFMETGSSPEGANGPISCGVDTLEKKVGDIVLARRDMGTSYHLSVVLDDAMQGITHVIRGRDLFDATKIHVVLQRLLGLPTPVYHHHKLIRDGQGKRLAKRDDARAISKYREVGYTPNDIRKWVGLPQR